MAQPPATYISPAALGYAYAPYGASQALNINPYALQAAQTEAVRRQNLNVQAHIMQIGDNNQNVQSDIGQSQRRQNLNAQSQISQAGRRQNMNAQSQLSQLGHRR